MKKRFAALLLCVLCALTAFAAAEEAPLPEMPQLIKVEFEKGKYESLPIQGRAPYKVNTAAYTEDGMRYSDETLDIQVHELRAFDTPVFVAFVQIADASQLRTEQARPYPSEATARTNTMGKRANAVLAVNGDWFVFHNGGIVYRQGKLLRTRPREDYDGLFIDVNGDFHITRPIRQEDVDAIGMPIMHSFCFGPALVWDGELVDNSARTVTQKQRMAIGQIDTLTYAVVCCDGPDEKDSVGLNMQQMSQIMQALGCKQAYNLDGGSSTYMYFNDRKINTDIPGRGRAVGDIVYFASAVPNK